MYIEPAVAQGYLALTDREQTRYLRSISLEERREFLIGLAFAIAEIERLDRLPDASARRQVAAV